MAFSTAGDVTDQHEDVTDVCVYFNIFSTVLLHIFTNKITTQNYCTKFLHYITCLQPRGHLPLHHPGFTTQFYYTILLTLNPTPYTLHPKHNLLHKITARNFYTISPVSNHAGISRFTTPLLLLAPNPPPFPPFTSSWAGGSSPPSSFTCHRETDREREIY